MDARILTHGSLSPLPEGIELRAGRLTVMYESGFIRYIRSGKHEVVRMINHYLRDQNWNTLPMHIHSEQVETTADSFMVAYAASVKHNDISFSWKCTITGNADDTLLFAIEGEAQSDFKTNRLGFTVLLPTEDLRGQSCRLTHPDNATEEVFFPDRISPHQPFLDIQSMAWSPASGVQAVILFTGDIFEMEDQRNWMDASHKVYCTPLSQGFPKQVKQGDRVVQSVHLKVFGDLHEEDNSGEVVTFSIENLNGRQLPSMGIPLSDVSVTPQQRQYVTALAPDFVSVIIKDLPDIDRRIPEALQFGRPLEIMLFQHSASPEEVILSLKAYAAHIVQVVVLVEGKRSADGALVDAFVPFLRKHLPKVRIGSGTDAFFTELNRNPTPASALDFLSFSVNPQTHAGDLRTMTENLVAHRDVVESCRVLSDGRDVRVGPVTLKMRWNPDATSGERPLPGALPSSVDTRQPSLYAAGWTLGSLKYLTESGARMVTYYELAGWRGLMAHPDQPWPVAFDIRDEQIYPVYLMLRLLLSQRGSVALPLKSSDVLKLDGMAFRDGRETTVVLANYTPDALLVPVPQGLDAVKLLVVGSGNIMKLLEKPLELPTLETFGRDTFSIPAFGFAVIKAVE
ncbi:MAG TPA: hypothetical protein VK658_21275 [Chryseolinea sp.]|nr:hypothetical protein [Chryseolinea sp.]